MIVYLVDDHALFREGMRFLLLKNNRIGTIYEAENGKQLLDNVEKNNPDIILMDIEMPVMNGIVATRKVLDVLPECKIIALSMYADECFYRDMLGAGAKGFLLKNSRFEDVQKAIEEVSNGNSFFSPEILNSILQNLNRPVKSTSTTDLSERETEVLYHICKGLQNQEIADLLSISKRTVDKHRENILLKTNSRNTAELVIYAIKNGLFVLD
ncbi:MAG: response regulator transcription factor [Marinilabiliaceae bacterium]|nr:response regulator transcription factor [Marinilabiliaceae bacterium]